MIFELGNTQADRMNADSALYDYIGEIESAELLLRHLWEEHFSKAEQGEIDGWTAEGIGLRIRAAADIIFSVLTEINLETGNSQWRDVPYQVERAKRIVEIQRVTELTDQANDTWNSMTTGAARDAFGAERDRIAQLPDAEAIPALEALLKSSKPICEQGT